MNELLWMALSKKIKKKLTLAKTVESSFSETQHHKMQVTEIIKIIAKKEIHTANGPK